MLKATSICLSRLFLILALGGCLNDPIRQTIHVAPSDSDTPPLDAYSADGDAGLISQLSLTTIKPNHGSFVGGTEVSLYGSGFTATLKAFIAGKPASDIQIASPTTVVLITPAGEVGPADVTVEQGEQHATIAGGFHYDPIEFAPDSGPRAGGTLVTISGKGTSFAKGMKLLLGGKPFTDIEVVSSSLIRAKTPANAPGAADFVFSENGQDVTVQDAFLYYESTNPKNGGMGGGPIDGTLTIAVLNRETRQPLAGASVVVEKEREFTLQGATDSSGLAVFSQDNLRGPLSVTAGMTDFETTSVLGFDARDLTLFLRPIPKPEPGPMPPGTLSGAVTGYVLFGGATGSGGTEWNLVPEPKKDQVKRVYVYASVPAISWGPPEATADSTIDFGQSGATAWPFTIHGFVGAVAVYAVAGLYHKVTQQFDPYAMGITRGIVVGPGEIVSADVWVTIPLTRQFTLKLKNVPAEVNHHRIRLAVDLGADGLILTKSWEAEGDGILSEMVFSRLPYFHYQGLTDATFTVDVLFENNLNGGVPSTRAIERAKLYPEDTLVIDEWVGVPLQVKPDPGGVLEGNTLVFEQNGSPHNLSITQLRLPDETPVWSIISAGSVIRAQLPDPNTFNLPHWPNGPVVWLQWLAHIPNFDFNTFNYSHTSSTYWDRWSFNELGFTVP